MGNTACTTCTRPIAATSKANRFPTSISTARARFCSARSSANSIHQWSRPPAALRCQHQLRCQSRNPRISKTKTASCAIAIIIGGLGSLWGTLAGGILLGLAQAVGGQINVGLPFIAGHVIFLIVLLVRPHGLFSRSS